MYGENPNWGRILSKIGSTVKVDYKKVRLSFSDDAKKAYALDRGRVCDRSKVGEIIKSKRIKIVVDLNSGHGKATGWGCDLSLEYVRINAEYN